jgi:hypothetical protein
MYAYKVSSDLQYNPNYEIWNRIKHYTESNKSAGSQYDLNQDRIYRLAKVLLEENTQTIKEAMEEQDHDRYSREWTSDEITILLRTEQVNLTEEEEATLQQILDESFNTAHPDFDIRKAVENLRKNFEGKVALCHECLLAKQCTELEEHQGYCDECYQELNELTLAEETILEEENITEAIELPEETAIELIEISEDTISKKRKDEKEDEKDQIIARLEARIQHLEDNFKKMLEFFQDQITHHQE